MYDMLGREQITIILIHTFPVVICCQTGPRPNLSELSWITSYSALHLLFKNRGSVSSSMLKLQDTVATRYRSCSSNNHR